MDFSRGTLVMVAILLFLQAEGQTNRYMVFFKDKSGTPFSISQPEQFLSTKCLARRARQGIVTDEPDLPVNPSYVAVLKNAGAKTYYTSRWLNGVLCAFNQDSLDYFRTLPIVDSVVYVGPGNTLPGGRIRKLKNKKSTADAGETLPQLAQLGMDEMHREGFHGENISIAVLDGGFPGVDTSTPFQSLNSDGRIKMTFNFVANSKNIYQACGECSHGTEVLSTMAVNTDVFTGGAFMADYYLFVTEDVSSEYRVEEYNWLFAAEKADSAGVDIISTSLGYNQFDDPSMDYVQADMNGKRSAVAKAAATAVSKGIMVVVAAGNEGGNSWGTITTPADVAGVLAAGAVDGGGALTLFSSQGPSADGRIKPDVVALGQTVSIVNPSGAIGANSGTSFSAPLVASLVAGTLQAYPFLTTSQLFNVIIKSANRASTPDNSYGYGIPYFPAVKNYVEQSDSISVYPNPSQTGAVNIRFTYNLGVAAVYFFDTFGRLLNQQNITIGPGNNPIVYDLSGYNAGVYVIKVRSSFATRTFRFVKSR